MKTWLALTSYWRATTDTEAPGFNVAATISRLSASGQRLFRRRLPSLVSTSDIMGTSPPNQHIKHGCQNRRRPSASQGGAHRRETPHVTNLVRDPFPRRRVDVRS